MVPIAHEAIAAWSSDTRIGDMHHIVRFDRDELGVSAIQPGISEEDLLGAQRLTSAATEAALATDRLALGGGDAIADRELLHRTADCDHGSGDLVTRHAGQHDSGAQCAGADGNVVRADAAESDPNDHIAWPGRRIGDSLADQGAVEVAGFAKNECAHSGGAYRIAIGLIGLPVPPTTGNGLAANRNSRRPVAASWCSNSPSSNGMPKSRINR